MTTVAAAVWAPSRAVNDGNKCFNGSTPGHRIAEHVRAHHNARARARGRRRARSSRARKSVVARTPVGGRRGRATHPQNASALRRRAAPRDGRVGRRGVGVRAAAHRDVLGRGRARRPERGAADVSRGHAAAAHGRGLGRTAQRAAGRRQPRARPAVRALVRGRRRLLRHPVLFGQRRRVLRLGRGRQLQHAHPRRLLRRDDVLLDVLHRRHVRRVRRHGGGRGRRRRGLRAIRDGARDGVVRRRHARVRGQLLRGPVRPRGRGLRQLLPRRARRRGRRDVGRAARDRRARGRARARLLVGAPRVRARDAPPPSSLAREYLARISPSPFPQFRSPLLSSPLAGTSARPTALRHAPRATRAASPPRRARSRASTA